MTEPLAIDLFCGLGGWTEGLIAEGYRVVGFDTERHRYGEARYPAQLVIQDVLTLDGARFKDAALIVASPPCQGYSYRAMPWTRAKALPPPDNALFEACFRIQCEASAAAGHLVPLVVENVCGAQKWVGRARWHFGSFYLWGDVPALMPITKRTKFKGGDRNIGRANGTHQWNTGFDVHTKVDGLKTTKNDGGSWFGIAHNTTSGHGQNPVNTVANAADGCKQRGSGPAWWRGELGSQSSQSPGRKAASAHIAKIPVELARHIARCWYPKAP